MLVLEVVVRVCVESFVVGWVDTRLFASFFCGLVEGDVEEFPSRSSPGSRDKCLALCYSMTAVAGVFMVGLNGLNDLFMFHNKSIRQDGWYVIVEYSLHT